jgi:glutamine cyclotransferase
LKTTRHSMGRVGMRAVYKYPLSLGEVFALELPEGAEILNVLSQRGDAFLYALVDPDAPAEEVSFRLAATGDPISEANELKYVDTFQLRDGGLVYHLFEIVTPRL